MTDPCNQTTPEEWTIYIRLGDIESAAADGWMDAIIEAVYARDPGFSGVVAMKKETVDP